MPEILKMTKISPTFRGADGNLYAKLTQAEALEHLHAIRGEDDSGKVAWYEAIYAPPKPMEPAK